MRTHSYHLFSRLTQKLIEVAKQDVTNGVQHKETHNSVQKQAPNSAIQKYDKTSDNISKFKKRATRRYLARQLKHNNSAQEDAFLDNYITWVEDEIMALAKWDIVAPKGASIENAHKGYQQKATHMSQKGK